VIVVLGFILIGFVIQRILSQRIYSKVLVAEIKQITEELQNTEKVKLSAIYENIEYDRKRISRDLHDSLGQILTSAKLKLEAFQHSGSVRDEQFEDSMGLLQNTGKVLRMIVHNLHPLEIDNYGLAASIKMICHEVNRDSNIKVYYFEQNYSGRLSKKSEVMVFRIVQEAVNNILKHSSSDELSLRILENADELIITVRDNGKGFKINGNGLSAEKNNTFGLVNMKQRAELIGAELTITSVLNLGTTINLRIPLNG
jgi:two-component system sensor histidine kinase UhpB